MEPGRITERQLAFLMTTILLATVIFFMPQIATRSVGQDAWLTAIIATIWGLVVVALIVALARRFPGLTLVEYLPIILGKPLGKLLGLIYAIWFISIGAVVIREFGIFLSITIMPRAPVTVFTVTITLLALYAVYNGLEVWTRVNEILLPLIILAIVVVIMLPYDFMDFRRLLPIGDHPLGELVASSIVSGSWRGEIFMAAMFIPALTTCRHSLRNLSLVVVIIGVMLVAVEVATVVVFGGVGSGQLELPVFSLARVTSVGRLLDRLEVLIVVIWVLGNFIKVCAFLYCAAQSTAQTFGFREYRFLLLPCTVLLLALADNLVENVVQLTLFLSRVWPGYALLSFQMVIPFILYLVVLVRRLGRSKA